jgi:hypothetical protein
MNEMIPMDTTPGAHEIQLEILRSHTGAQRLRMALQLSEDVRGISRAGIRSRHPEYSEQELTWALNRLMLGDVLFQKAWPGAPLLSS